MKNILAKLGNKKTAGSILVALTLMVGLGVVSNFSGSDQKAANEAALARFSQGANTGSSGSEKKTASRADIESQMAAMQNAGSMNFTEGKGDDDFFGAYNDADDTNQNEEGFVYGAYEGEGGADGTKMYVKNMDYDPSDPAYGGAASGQGANSQGAYDEYGADGQGAAGKGGAGAKAGKAGKGSRNPALTYKVRPVTQVNRLESSGGGLSFGGSSGGGSGAGGSYSGSGVSGDSSTRVLPNNPVKSGQADSEAFKFGRAGAMGGFNVAQGGKAAKNGNRKSSNVTNQLIEAVGFSKKGVATQYSEGAKQAVENAFDGGGDPEGLPVVEDGASIGKVANDMMSANNLGGLPDAIQQQFNDIENELNEKTEKLEALQKKLNGVMWATGITAVVAALAIMILRNVPGYGTLAAAIVTAVAVIAIALLGVWMFNIIGEMGSEELSPVNDGLDLDGKKLLAGIILAGSGIMLILAWTQVGKQIGQWLRNLYLQIFGKPAAGVVTEGAGGGAGAGGAGGASGGAGGSVGGEIVGESGPGFSSLG